MSENTGFPDGVKILEKMRENFELQKDIVIGNKEIDLIKDFARKAFHQTPQFIDLDANEMQIACILMGIETFMKSRGKPVRYEVRLKKYHDSLPVDESGLGDIE